MELRVLRNLTVLAEESHFGRAAQRCHIAQSALSQQVKQLETDLGVRLFERSTRHVAITDAGRRFLDHARRIVAAADRAEADMREVAAGRSGPVSVGFVGTATYDVLPRVARQVRETYPDIDLTLVGERLNPVLIESVTTGALDLALIRPPADDLSGLTLEPLRSERLIAVLPEGHRLADRTHLDLAELARETFVIHPSGDRSSIHQQVLAACAAAGFVPPSLVEVGETATLAVFVAAGLGVALAPEPVRSLRLAGVTYVDLDDDVSVELALISRSSAPSPACANVVEVIHRCLQAGPR